MSIRGIEELSMNAWPALQTYLYDGWVLRVSGGYTKRANSVNLLYPSFIELNQKIDYCKTFYENMGLPVVYKLTSQEDSMLLDGKLNELGYKKIDETSVMVLNLDDFTINGDVSEDVSYELTKDWLNGYCKSCRINSKSERKILKAMLKNILGKVVFVSYKFNNKWIAFGYGAIDQGYVGIFDIYVDELYRGKGYGKLIMNTLLGASKQSSVNKAYLQVVVGNSLAEKLYKNLGFKEMHRYWYRKL